jgi:hypothetical protein
MYFGTFRSLPVHIKGSLSLSAISIRIVLLSQSLYDVILGYRVVKLELN